MEVDCRPVNKRRRERDSANMGEGQMEWEDGYEVSDTKGCVRMVDLNVEVIVWEWNKAGWTGGESLGGWMDGLMINGEVDIWMNR